MESLEELKKKIDISQRYMDIIKHINNSECPICHNKSLKYEQQLSGSLDYGGCWHSQIKCNCCNIFKSDYKVTGHELYHMNMRDAGELQMLEGAYNKCKSYLD